MKAGGGAKQNVSLEQGAQVSTASQRAATTTRHRHTDKLSGDTYQPLYTPRLAKREGQTAAQRHDFYLERTARPSRVSTRHLKLGETRMPNRGA